MNTSKKMDKRTDIQDTGRKTILKYILLIIFLSFIELGAIYYLNIWRGVFWEAIEQRHAQEFLYLVGLFTIAAFACIYANATSQYIESKLSVIWRIKMTRAYLPFFEESMKNQEIDNPDQRITDDIRKYTLQAVPWIVGVLFNLIKFLMFLGVLMYLSLEIFGHTWILPVGTVLYTAIGLTITILMGRKLVGLSFAAQKLEANYRFGLSKWRTGTNDNKHEHRFWEALKVVLDVFRYQKYLGLWTQSFSQASIIIPILFLAPVFFVSPAFGFGLFMRAINAIGEAQSALSYLVDQYQQIVDWLACRRRLKAYRELMQSKIYKKTRFL